MFSLRFFIIASVLLALFTLLWSGKPLQQGALPQARVLPQSVVAGDIQPDKTHDGVQDQLEVELQGLLDRLMQTAESVDAANARITEMPVRPRPTLREQLRAAGVADSIIDALQQQLRQNRFSLRELRAQALREGWIDSPQYRQRSNVSGDPTRGLREMFGDYVFDLYLYFTGHPNRVQIDAVAPDSAAAEAGLQAGDVIIRYTSNNIYSVFDLRRAWQRGEADENVLLEFLRDGRRLSTTLLRGKLDVRLKMVAREPDD